MRDRLKVGLMLIAFAVCGAAAWVHGLIHVQRAAVRPAELYAVVHRQLMAFQDDDFSRAYQQASTGFQEKFNVDEFTGMIRSDYGAIIDAERVEFGPVEVEGQRALIQVFFFDAQGQVLPCIYSLVREEETWKIDGARTLRRWRAGQRLGGMRA